MTDLLYRVATLLENPGKSWNWQKKIPGPGKSLNLGLQSLKILEWAKCFTFIKFINIMTINVFTKAH